MIQVRDLQKSFGTPHGTVEVLRGIDLDIAEGERLAVVGASGSGKSTFMHLLGGLDRPSGGTVSFDGKDLFGLGAAALDRFRNRTIGFVFQFHQLLPEFSALENALLPGMIAGLPPAENERRARTLLEEVGLGHRLRHKPGALSGGEQRRVAIARALCMEPRVLLADEPTGNLDSQTTNDILALLNRLHHSRRLTMIIVSHSEALAARMDRVVRMQDGRLNHERGVTSQLKGDRMP